MFKMAPSGQRALTQTVQVYDGPRETFQRVPDDRGGERCFRTDQSTLSVLGAQRRSRRPLFSAASRRGAIRAYGKNAGFSYVECAYDAFRRRRRIWMPCSRFKGVLTLPFRLLEAAVGVGFTPIAHFNVGRPLSVRRIWRERMHRDRLVTTYSVE